MVAACKVSSPPDKFQKFQSVHTKTSGSSPGSKVDEFPPPPPNYRIKNRYT